MRSTGRHTPTLPHRPRGSVKPRLRRSTSRHQAERCHHTHRGPKASQPCCTARQRLGWVPRWGPLRPVPRAVSASGSISMLFHSERPEQRPEPLQVPKVWAGIEAQKDNRVERRPFLYELHCRSAGICVARMLSSTARLRPEGPYMNTFILRLVPVRCRIGRPGMVVSRSRRIGS